MKLVYVTIAGLALSLSGVEAGPSGAWKKRMCAKGVKKHCPKGNQNASSLCSDNQSFLGAMIQNNDRSEEEVLAAQEAALEVMLSWEDPEGRCAQAQMESAMIMNAGARLSGQCNEQATRESGTLLVAAMCEMANTGCDGEGCHATRSAAVAEAAVAKEQFVTLNLAKAIGILDDSNEKAVEAIDAEVSEEGVDGILEASRSKAMAKQVNKDQDFKKAMADASGDVWNVVVSGGPEYCRDMFPKFPRIIHGKMNRNHPNYYAVKTIRDSCVRLLSIIKSVKCVCQYLMWGDQYKFPKYARGNHRAKFGQRYAKVCYYLSMLKGSFKRPATARHDPFCNKGYVNNNAKPNKPQQHQVGSGQIVGVNTEIGGIVTVNGQTFHNEEIKQMSVEQVISYNSFEMLAAKASAILKKLNSDRARCKRKTKCNQQVLKKNKDKFILVAQYMIQFFADVGDKKKKEIFEWGQDVKKLWERIDASPQYSLKDDWFNYPVESNTAVVTIYNEMKANYNV